MIRRLLEAMKGEGASNSEDENELKETTSVPLSTQNKEASNPQLDGVRERYTEETAEKCDDYKFLENEPFLV